MFHFSNRQLHIIISFLVISVLLIASFLVFRKNDGIFIKGTIGKLKDYSEGWIASYETLDDAKWRKYGNTDDKNGNRDITEVLNLPDSFDVKAGEYVTLTHKIPDFDAGEEYIVFNSKDQILQIMAENDLIYESDESEIAFPYHIVSIDHQYANGDLTIKVKNDNKDRIVFEAVKIGNYNELISDALKDNGWLFLYGIFLLLFGIVLCVFVLFYKSRAPKKYLLNYISAEAFFTGLLFCIESTLFRTLIHWEMFNYFLRSVVIIIVTILHLFVMRSMINRVKILSVIDFGIIIYCIEFISVLILAWFRLISFDLIYYVICILSALGFVIYTLLMGTASYDYRQKDGRPVFIANLILLCAAIFELVFYVTRAGKIALCLPVIIGSLIYFNILAGYGIKQSLAINGAEKVDDSEMSDIIRQQVIDGFNPNLLFASFQALQNMIKSGSENSTKMIYYISMYIMDNIKAMNDQGEIISFSEELEHIMAYLNLQRTRNSGLSFMIESKVKDFKVPRNTIEPLVENAVKYGIGGKNNKGNVVVRSYSREDGYAIQIIDNGIGFDSSRLKNTGPKSIKNVFGLLSDKCKAKTEIVSKEKKGTVITIIIPMIDNELI